MTVIFTDADLKANREGRLTNAQRPRVEARATEKWRVMRITLPLMWLVFIILAFGTLGLFRKVANDTVMIGIVFVWSLIAVVFTLGIWRPFRAYARGDIRSCSTTCQMFHRPYGKDEEKATYALKIRMGLISSQMVYVQDVASLRPGCRYCVYYLEDNPPMLLSWEEQPES